MMPLCNIASSALLIALYAKMYNNALLAIPRIFTVRLCNHVYLTLYFIYQGV